MKRKSFLKVATATAAFAVLVTTVYAQEKDDKPVMTNQTIAVEHIRIESAKSFADVRAALERSVPHLDPSLVKALDAGDVARAIQEKKEGPELSIFQSRDHGAILQIDGIARHAVNPQNRSMVTGLEN